MNKRILVLGLAVALCGVSATTFAADRDDGNFYIGANVGQADYDFDAGADFDTKDTAAAVRFGYVWHGNVDFAVEGGYVRLGKITNDYTTGDYSVHAELEDEGVFAGVKVAYRFADAWYVAARGGLFESRVEETEHAHSPNADSARSGRETSSNLYLGVGVGYDVTRNFSLGLDYDNYRGGYDGDDFDTGMLSLAAEYRF